MECDKDRAKVCQAIRRACLGGLYRPHWLAEEVMRLHIEKDNAEQSALMYFLDPGRPAKRGNKYRSTRAFKRLQTVFARLAAEKEWPCENVRGCRTRHSCVWTELSRLTQTRGQINRVFAFIFKKTWFEHRVIPYIQSTRRYLEETGLMTCSIPFRKIEKSVDFYGQCQIVGSSVFDVEIAPQKDEAPAARKKREFLENVEFDASQVSGEAALGLSRSLMNLPEFSSGTLKEDERQIFECIEVREMKPTNVGKSYRYSRSVLIVAPRKKLIGMSFYVAWLISERDRHQLSDSRDVERGKADETKKIDHFPKVHFGLVQEYGDHFLINMQSVEKRGSKRRSVIHFRMEYEESSGADNAEKVFGWTNLLGRRYRRLFKDVPVSDASTQGGGVVQKPSESQLYFSRLSGIHFHDELPGEYSSCVLRKKKFEGMSIAEIVSSSSMLRPEGAEKNPVLYTKEFVYKDDRFSDVKYTSPDLIGMQNVTLDEHEKKTFRELVAKLSA